MTWTSGTDPAVRWMSADAPGVEQHLSARQSVWAQFSRHSRFASKVQNVLQSKMPGGAIGMGDHPIGLPVRGRSGTVGGKEHGEQERPKPGQFPCRTVQRGFKGRDRQMGEDPPGDGQRNSVGDAGKSEGRILDKLLGG